MKLFLDDIISTLSGRKDENAGDILNDVSVSRDQIQSVAKRLVSLQSFSPLILNSETPFNTVSGGSIKQNFRNLNVRIAEMYNISDLITLLVNSSNLLLNSQIKALEQELNSLQKMADNYSFLLSDGGSYNFAYLEPFNDEIGRDDFPFNIPDRAAQQFSLLDQAIVVPDEGVLALTSGIAHPVVATGAITASNASAFLISDNGLSNALNPNSGTGWLYHLKAPNPIT